MSSLDDYLKYLKNLPDKKYAKKHAKGHLRKIKQEKKSGYSASSFDGLPFDTVITKLENFIK